MSVNIPADKARAVVAALEQEMTTTLATKSDLDHLRDELHATRDLLRQELHATRDALRSEIIAVGSSVDTLRDSLKQERAADRESTAKDTKNLEQRLQIKLGYMLAAGLTLQTAVLAFLVKL